MLQWSQQGQAYDGRNFNADLSRLPYFFAIRQVSKALEIPSAIQTPTRKASQPIWLWINKTLVPFCERIAGPPRMWWDYCEVAVIFPVLDEKPLVSLEVGPVFNICFFCFLSQVSNDLTPHKYGNIIENSLLNQSPYGSPTWIFQEFQGHGTPLTSSSSRSFWAKSSSTFCLKVPFESSFYGLNMWILPAKWWNHGYIVGI